MARHVFIETNRGREEKFEKLMAAIRKIYRFRGNEVALLMEHVHHETRGEAARKIKGASTGLRCSHLAYKWLTSAWPARRVANQRRLRVVFLRAVDFFAALRFLGAGDSTRGCRRQLSSRVDLPEVREARFAAMASARSLRRRMSSPWRCARSRKYSEIVGRGLAG